MDTTSSQLPVCVYCGTPRPADESSCPTCGKGWIDVRVGDLADSPVNPTDQPANSSNTVDPDEASARTSPPPAPPPVPPIAPPPSAPSIDDTGEFSFDDWTLPPDRPRNRGIWLIPIVLLIAVVIVWILVFLDNGTTTTTTTPAAETTTTTVPETTTTTVSDTTTTTVPETTTTTLAAFPPPATWPPTGDPIDAADLTLRAAGIGPIDIGSPIADVAGALGATFGEAIASGDDDLCPPAESYWLQWSDLRVIFDGFGDDATFVSYRYVDVGAGEPLGLSTLSGLTVGDTVADLGQIYSQFTITFELIDGVDHFRLNDGGELLLWGPVSSTEPEGIVGGIYSPSPCDTP